MPPTDEQYERVLASINTLREEFIKPRQVEPEGITWKIVAGWLIAAMAAISGILATAATDKLNTVTQTLERIDNQHVRDRDDQKREMEKLRLELAYRKSAITEIEDMRRNVIPEIRKLVSANARSIGKVETRVERIGDGIQWLIKARTQEMDKGQLRESGPPPLALNEEE